MTKYIGNELELFEKAHNWKKYYAEKLKPYIEGDVLEVGAGTGNSSKYLLSNKINSWTFLEPDGDLINKIDTKYLKELNLNFSLINSYTYDLPTDRLFDSIIYIDVLEHIEDDFQELVRISKHLNEGGFVVSLSPAHPFLYNEFDKSIGHFRRYNKKQFRNLTIPSLKLIELSYLDSIGLSASLMNKMFLKQSLPTVIQVKLWDDYMVPVSKSIDKILGFKVGKSIISIWEKVGIGK